MSRATEQEIFSELDNGNLIQYVEKRLFQGKVDSLGPHIERKQALAEPTRYSILYLLYEYGKVSRIRLASESGRDSNDLQHHLNELLDTNLIAKISAPEDADERQTYYRITSLGKQEISSDIENIVGGQAYKNRFKVLGDPELIEGQSESGDRIRTIVGAGEEGIKNLDDRRSDLRSRRIDFQRVASQE